MSRKLLTFVAVGVFVVGLAGISKADVWSQEKYGYGPSEGVDHTMQHETLHSGANASTTDQGMAHTDSAEMRGPVETGSMPDQGLSGFERGIESGNQTLNSDQIDGSVPPENWNSFPHGRENIEAGE